jgi:hypothetical protein
VTEKNRSRKSGEDRIITEETRSLSLSLSVHFPINFTSIKNKPILQNKINPSLLNHYLDFFHTHFLLSDPNPLILYYYIIVNIGLIRPCNLLKFNADVLQQTPLYSSIPSLSILGKEGFFFCTIAFRSAALGVKEVLRKSKKGSRKEAVK